MKTNKILLVVAFIISIIGAILIINNQETGIFLLPGVILGTISGTLHARFLNRNIFLWAALCTIMPYIFTLILVFLKSKKSVDLDENIYKKPKPYINILFGIILFVVGGVIIEYNMILNQNLKLFIAGLSGLFGIVHIIMGITLSVIPHKKSNVR